MGIGTWLAFDAPSTQQLALIGELHHLVIAVVGDPHVVLFIDTKAVRIAEDTLAPRAQIFPLGVEYYDGIGFRAALKNVYVARRIGGDGGDAPEFPAVGHGVGLLAEANVHAVLHQSAFVRIPALLGGNGGESHKRQPENLHDKPP